MKKLSTALLATTLAVSMVSPVSVFARDNKIEELAHKAAEKVENVEKDIKKDVEKEEVKHLEKKEEKEEKKEAKLEKKEEKEEKKEEKILEKEEKEEKDVIVSPQKVTLDGKEVKIHGYNIDGNNYFKLRDLAAVLKDTDAKFAVDYKAPEKDQKTGEIILEPGKEYKVLDTDLKEVKAKSKGKVTNDKVKVGEKDLEAKAYKIDGNNYYKLRDLAKELHFGVKYDEKTNTVLLSAKEEKETVKEEVKEEVKKVDEKLKENGKEEAKEIEKQAEKTEKQNLTENTVQ